jgi:hypothetical protein
MTFLLAFFFTFIACVIFVPVLTALGKFFCLFATLQECEVVNRLRQVTSAIRQQGANQVAIIKSGAERTAAAEFAHASAVRPYLVGKAIQEIAKDKEILNTVFEILETEKMLDGDVELTLVPRDNLFAKLLAAGNGSQPLAPAP